MIAPELDDSAVLVVGSAPEPEVLHGLAASARLGQPVIDLNVVSPDVRHWRTMGRSKEVDAWFGKYENPMKDVVLRIREIVLAADARMEECIKWQAPTFTYRGNLASFFPKSKQHASLMFHVGAKIPGKHPRLEGTGDTSRVLKIGSVAEANAAKRDIERIVKAWCDWRAEDAGNEPRGSSRAKKPPEKSAPARKTTRRT